MTPPFPINDSVNLAPLNAESFRNDAMWEDAVQGADISDHIVGEVRPRAVLANAVILAIAFVHVIGIVFTGPSQDMTGIEARRIVAFVSTHWHWPVAVRKVKGYAMCFMRTLLEINLSIAVTVFSEWPQKTIIRIVRLHGLYKPLAVRDCVRLDSTHRCSPVTSVSGGCAFASALPFSL